MKIYHCNINIKSWIRKMEISVPLGTIECNQYWSKLPQINAVQLSHLQTYNNEEMIQWKIKISTFIVDGLALFLVALLTSISGLLLSVCFIGCWASFIRYNHHGVCVRISSRNYKKYRYVTNFWFIEKSKEFWL